MAEGVYARRYARAIFRRALDRKEINQWQSGLRRLASLLKDEAISALLRKADVSFDDKARAISERLEDVDPLAIKLVGLLITKDRLELINEIADAYQQMVDNYRGIEGVEMAEIITAIPLDEEEKLSLGQRLSALVDKPVVLESKVDPGLIGGIIIKVDDKLIDGSIRSRLEALRRELSQAGQ
jgi:F-type H+-transporting ATPase subunit delta